MKAFLSQDIKPKTNLDIQNIILLNITIMIRIYTVKYF